MEKSDNDDFCRKLRLTEFFEVPEEQSQSIVTPKSVFVPPDGRNEVLDKIVSMLKSVSPPEKKGSFSHNITQR